MRLVYPDANLSPFNQIARSQVPSLPSRDFATSVMPSSDSEGSAPSEYGYDGTDEESIGVDDREVLRRGELRKGTRHSRIQELRDMPFEALLKARKGLGEGDTPAPKATAPKQRRDQKKSAAPSSREHRSHHAPAEMSSRKPVTRRRQVVELPHVERRDPRFSTVVGGSEHNAERARRNYAFVREYQQSELDSLAKAIKSARSADVRAELERERTALVSWDRPEGICFY